MARLLCGLLWVSLSVGCEENRNIAVEDAGVADASHDDATVSDLRPKGEGIEPASSDELVVSGEVCTSDPTSVTFPVKVMFVVDCSGSMQFSDPSDENTETTFDGVIGSASAKETCLTTCASTGASNCAALCSGTGAPGRQVAVKNIVDSYKNTPSVEFAIIRFNSTVTVNGGAPGCEGFSNDPSCISKGLDSLTRAETFTDYQSALTTAHDVLQQDMLAATAVERSRTKYVVVFLSDGPPHPQCTSGCGNDLFPPLSGSWCDTPRAEWCESFFVDGLRCDNMKTWFPALTTPCAAFNSLSQVLQQVDAIMDLGVKHGVGEIRLHSALLFASALPPAILDLFDPTPKDLVPLEERVAEILIAIAKYGDGLYRSYAGRQIDFSDFNYESLARPSGLTKLLVTNSNVRPDVNHLEPDSDGDGVTDSDELEVDLDPLDPDSDGDGFNDRLEHRMRQAGFDPGDPTIPAKACVNTGDLDGDGLRGCEEAVLGTDPALADSDRDRVPDGIEFLWGTDPTKSDVHTDADFDGKDNADEISSHTDPIVADPEVQYEFRYVYDVGQQAEQPETRAKCYDFTVSNIRLAATRGKQAAGYNELLVYFGEGPADNPADYGTFKAACIRARYEGGARDPVNGKVSLRNTDFMALPKLLEAREKARVNPDLDPCVGVALP